MKFNKSTRSKGLRLQTIGTLFITTVLILISFFSSAHIRTFTYVYDSDYMPDNLFEFEQWTTYTSIQEGNTKERIWSMRSEFEYSLRPNLATAFYLNFEDEFKVGEEESERHFKFEGISSEWFWRLSNPRTQDIGIGLYGEVGYGSQERELEEKIIISKRFNKFNTALNIIAEQEWEHEVEHEDGEVEIEKEREGVLDITGGVSYQIKNFNLGLEFRHHNGWHDQLLPGAPGNAEQTFNIGPSFNYSSSTWWATMTLFPQPEHNLNEMMEARLIFGIVLDQPNNNTAQK